MKYILSVLVLLVSSLGFSQNQEKISKSGVVLNRESVTADKTNDFDHTTFWNNARASDRELSTPNPSYEAVALYRFLQDQFGKRMLAGNQWVQWGVNELDYIENATGKLPAMAGFDYINEPQNQEENDRAIDFWNDGGIVTIMYHQGAPGIGEGYENSLETIDIDQIFIEGTPENVDFWGDLERIGNYLQELEDANIPVLWRPYHELTGNWFWWSKGGSARFKQLWITMYDYLVTERELNNLIWVLCYTDNPRNGDWFPGDEYVDIAGGDTYDNLTTSHIEMFTDVANAIGGNDYPIAFHENGNPPDPLNCWLDQAMWSWWMVWHTSWLTDLDTEYLSYVYNHELVTTLDELPDIVEVYGGDDYVPPLSIEDDLQHAISVYPSPVADQLNISIDRDFYGVSQFKVFDLNGSLVLEHNSRSEDEQINLSNLRSGIYSLVVINDFGTSVHKFLKN